jgi:hypothetical protein
MLFLLLAFVQKPDVPFIDKEFYQYEIEYILKSKPESTLAYEADKKRISGDMLPFVSIHFTFPAFLPDDKRIRIYQGTKMIKNTRIKGPLKVLMVMGYSADLKEKVVPADFYLYIINDQNEPRGQIHVEVKSNGELLINGISSGLI